MKNNSKIIRTWRGWTTPENAKIYENLLVNKIFPDVKKKGAFGLEKVSISIRSTKEEVEFLLNLQFDSLESVKTFAGSNYEVAYIPEEAKQILSRHDKTAKHYNLKKELIY